MTHQSVSSPSTDDDEIKVVIEQTLLKVEEVFVYRIPPCPTSGGHRADDWNLANPQATCSLVVLRRDSALLIRLFADQPMEGGPPGAKEQVLFAQCKMDLDMSGSAASSSTASSSTQQQQQSQRPKPNMEYWVEAVTDSSRYFAIRISDEKTGREAHVGMGFRERNDALSFKMSLQEYENIMRKEAVALNMSDSASSNSSSTGHMDGVSSLSQGQSISGGKSSDHCAESIAAVSKLSLKEGETIHVNIKSGSGASTKPRSKKGQQDGGGIKLPMLLKKPPSSLSATSISSSGQAVVFDTDIMRSRSGISGVHHDVSSVIAVAETMDTEDEWGDFESVPSSGVTED